MEYSNSGGADSRRDFLKKTGATVLGTALAGANTFAGSINLGHNADKVLRVGLIGCGGRGTGAAMQALKADPGVHITALGDVFEDKLNESLATLIKVGGDRVKVDAAKRFIGFDAYQKVIDSGVDVVLLAAPPYARPHHLAAAIRAGKHAFAEKPVAVDGPGVRSILASAKLAKEKNLSLVSGFCFRYDAANRETFGRVLKGDVGEIRNVTTYRYGGELWSFPRKEGWSDMEYQLRNWYYYHWLSGDFITEVTVHSLDMMAWALGDRTPLKAIGVGGRQKRTDPLFGNIYDHFAVEYEYPNGVKGYSFSRQHLGCPGRNTVEVFGADGKTDIAIYKHYKISGKNAWEFQGKHNVMHQAEQDEFFASIRKGKPINDGTWMAHSTMLGIMGRMAAYSGQEITWDDAMNSNISIGPRYEDYAWDLKWPVSEVPIPGITKV